MKTLFLIIIMFISVAEKAFSQTESDSFVTTINSAWAAKDYPSIATAIESALLTRSDDFVVQYVAYNFYLTIQPNMQKLEASAVAISAIADGENAPVLLKEISSRIMTNLPAIRHEGLQVPSQALIDRLHESSPEKFPLIDIGIQLQRETQD